MKWKRAGYGVYESECGKFQIQNPHKMYAPDKDRSWYVVGVAGEHVTYGPFDTLKEAKAYFEQEHGQA